MTRSEHGLPIGDPVPGWTPRRRPEPGPFHGRTCSVVPLQPAHAEELYGGCHGPEARGLWTYLSGLPGPFADVASFAGAIAGQVADPASESVAITVDGRAEGLASYLRIVGPSYGFFGLALALYFASQGAGRLFWPLSAGFLRMLIAIGGGWLVLRLTGSLHWLFAALALGLLVHGLTLLAAIGTGAWFRGPAARGGASWVMPFAASSCRSHGLDSVPRIAVAAATSGETRCVRPPFPWRPSKLRFDVDAQRSPGAS